MALTIQAKVRNSLCLLLNSGCLSALGFHGDVECPFPVDVTRYAGIQPFLLIIRTGRIVTPHVATLSTGCDISSTAGSTGLSSI